MSPSHTSLPSVCSTRPTLKKGSGCGCEAHLKDEVCQMQALLNKVGGYSIPVDGDFGNNTERTVKDFQCKNGLHGDGIVGPHTWSKLCVEENPLPPVCKTRPTLRKGCGCGSQSHLRDEVCQMQALLNKVGGYSIPVDGDFGNNTERTVKDFQCKNGLHGDGVVGPHTWGKLCC